MYVWWYQGLPRMVTAPPRVCCCWMYVFVPDKTWIPTKKHIAPGFSVTSTLTLPHPWSYLLISCNLARLQYMSGCYKVSHRIHHICKVSSNSFVEPFWNRSNILKFSNIQVFYWGWSKLDGCRLFGGGLSMHQICPNIDQCYSNCRDSYRQGITQSRSLGTNISESKKSLGRLSDSYPPWN